MQIKVCGLETINVLKESESISYYKYESSKIISEKTLEEFFKVDDIDCPIISFELKD